MSGAILGSDLQRTRCHSAVPLFPRPHRLLRKQLPASWQNTASVSEGRGDDSDKRRPCDAFPINTCQTRLPFYPNGNKIARHQLLSHSEPWRLFRPDVSPRRDVHRPTFGCERFDSASLSPSRVELSQSGPRICFEISKSSRAASCASPQEQRISNSRLTNRFNTPLRLSQQHWAVMKPWALVETSVLW